MSSFFDLLREQPSYLETATQGLKKKISLYYMDYTRGETDRSWLLILPRENWSWEEAFIILTQRQLMIGEHWLDFENYEAEDLIRWTGLLRTNYLNSNYEENIVLHTDNDRAFFLERLNSEDQLQELTYNEQPISYTDFKQTCPLFTEEILRVSKSHFKRLEVEYYLETKNHYLLYNWYTTA